MVYIIEATNIGLISIQHKIDPFQVVIEVIGLIPYIFLVIFFEKNCKQVWKLVLDIYIFIGAS